MSETCHNQTAWLPRSTRNHIKSAALKRFGSEAGIAARFGHVRYTPKSRQTQRRLVLPAKSQQQTSSFGVRL